MADTTRYLEIIVPEHAGQPNLRSTLDGLTQPIAAAKDAVAHLPIDFDLDVSVGAQLDIDGQFIGLTRHVRIVQPSPWFSFDIITLGFDQGIWKGPYQNLRQDVSLDDTTYRRLLRSRIVANSLDGNKDNAQDVLDTFFIDPTTNVFVLDGGTALAPGNWFSFDIVGLGFNQSRWRQRNEDSHGDMSMSVNVSGKIPSRIDLGLLDGGYLPINPAGVKIDIFVTSIDNTALFGFDVQNQYISGFDAGSWGQSPEIIASKPLVQIELLPSRISIIGGNLNAYRNVHTYFSTFSPNSIPIVSGALAVNFSGGGSLSTTVTADNALVKADSGYITADGARLDLADSTLMTVDSLNLTVDRI